MKQHPHTDTPRYIRRPEPGPLRSTARRIRRGDDFAGDAWQDTQAGELRWVVVGYDPNTANKGATNE